MGFVSDVFSGIFGGGKSESPAPIIMPAPPAVSMAPPPPTVQAPQAQQSAAQQRAKAAAVAGATIATGPGGLLDKPKSAKTSLLGG